MGKRPGAVSESAMYPRHLTDPDDGFRGGTLRSDGLREPKEVRQREAVLCTNVHF